MHGFERHHKNKSTSSIIILSNAVNDSYFDIIQMNSEKTFIRLGNITNAASTGYPKTLNTQKYYK